MNNKGFTLVELLSIMILLTAIALIAFPIIDNHLKEAREESYKANITKIIEATKNFVIKYSDEIEFSEENINDNTRYYDLNLDSLKETEYLDDTAIIDPRSNKEMDGCIRIIVDKNYKYNYKYDEECNFND